MRGGGSISAYQPTISAEFRKNLQIVYGIIKIKSFWKNLGYLKFREIIPEKFDAKNDEFDW